MSKLNSIGRVVSESWHGLWVNGIAKSAVIPDVLRCGIYRMNGLRVNTKRIKPGVTVRGKNLTIKGDSLINYNCVIDASAPVTIGTTVSIAFGVMVCTSTHEIGDMKDRAGTTLRLPVTIEDGSWIGANSTILPGVTIGKGCIVAAGSVVTKDCEPNGLYAGVPAKRIKDLSVDELHRQVG